MALLNQVVGQAQGYTTNQVKEALAALSGAQHKRKNSVDELHISYLSEYMLDDTIALVDITFNDISIRNLVAKLSKH